VRTALRIAVSVAVRLAVRVAVRTRVEHDTGSFLHTHHHPRVTVGS